MRPSEALSLHRSQIREIALRHRVSSVRVFGSALHGDDTADSDLDLLVEPTAQTTLMDIGAIRFELKQLLGMEVDVLTPNSLPANFRDQVLREAMAVDDLDSCGIYFGTTGGQVYASADGGDNWSPIVHDLPSVLSVEVQTLP